MKAARGAHHSLTPLLVTVILLLACVACSGEGESSTAETPTPGPSQATPVSAQTPATGPTVPAPTPVASAPAIPSTTIPVRWVPVADILLATAVEEARPFPDIRNNFSGTPVWSVHATDDAGNLRRVLEAPRWVDRLSWESDTVLLAGFRTERRLTVSSSANASSALLWPGSYRVDLTANRANESFEVFPNDLTQAIDKPVSAQRQPDGKRLLVTVSSGTPTTQPQAYELRDILIVDEAGKARRLEGITGLRSVAWVPNGKAIVGIKSGAPGVQDALFIPATDGDATLISSFEGMAIESSQGIPSDPKAHRVAVLKTDPAQASRPALVGVYDSDSNQFRTVGSSAAGAAMGVVWPAVGETILIAGTELFDVSTGRGRPGTYTDVFPAPYADGFPSPDGRYVARFDEPTGVSVAPTCAGLPYNLKLEDKSAGATKTVLQCHAGTSGYVTWVSNTKFVALVNSCWACETDRHAIYLVDAPTGVVAGLSQGLEAGASAVPSPDDRRIAVTGTTLRVFNGDGVLQRDYGAAPPGFVMTQVTWSPDGTKFAYIQHPLGWSYGP